MISQNIIGNLVKRLTHAAPDHVVKVRGGVVQKILDALQVRELDVFRDIQKLRFNLF